MQTVAQIFAKTLKEIGVRFIFGVPSGNMIDYIEAVRYEKGIDFVLVGSETTAAFMAGVCGRLTGIPGVCFGTFGPGATNLSTGVGGAFLDRFPLIAFTDEMPEHLISRTVQMNIDHQQLFKPITKLTTRLTHENAKEIILQAAAIAVSELPGPVHIGVPAGIGSCKSEELSEEKLNFQSGKDVGKEMVEAIFKVKTKLTEAKKPVIAVGLSSVRYDIKEKLILFAEKFNIPVILTPMAKGMFPETHDLYAGVLFHALSNYVAKVYNQADLVIGFGYDPIEFNYEDWMPNVPLIHIDNKTADINRAEYPDVSDITGDLAELLRNFLTLECDKKSWDTEKLVEFKNSLFQKFAPSQESFGPLAIVEDLRKALPEEGTLTVDVGAHLHLIGQMWRTPSPEKLLMTNGWSSMGFAVPAALAVKLCHPELPVAAIMGDGGFLMTVGELATAKRLNLKIVFIVIYDNSLSLIRIKQEKKKFNSHYGTDLNLLSAQPTNYYFGVPVIRATNRREYQFALEKAFSSDGPVVIEAVAIGDEYDTLVLKSNK